MKKILSILMIAVLCFTLVPSTANAAVKISNKKATMFVSDTLQLKITGTTKKATWTSGNEKIAQVTNTGKVTAITEGTVTISAKIGAKKYSCKVTCKYDIDSMKTDLYNWVVSDLWNDSFCDIYHYVEDGKNAVGEDMDINTSIKNADKAMQKAFIYDDFVDSLSDSDYAELKSLWVNIRSEIDYLYGRIKEETPRPEDTTYEFKYQSFNDYMYQLMDVVYQ